MRFCIALRHRSTAGQVALILCGFALGLGVLSENAAAQDESPRLFYYSTVENLDNPKAGPNVHVLTMSTQKIGVMFEEGLTAVQQGDLLAKHSEVGNVAEEGEWRTIRHTRSMLVVPLRDVKATDQVEGLLSRLENETEVTVATPVFQITPGFDELLTDEFFASFPANTPKEEIEKLNSLYGVEVVYTRDWRIIGKIGYRLRVTPASGMNALEMANLYAEHGLAVRATPALVPLYQLAQVTPSDTYYGSQWSLPRIEAPDAWDIETGSSAITIAILDTGIDLDHEDLDDRLLRDAYDEVVGRNFSVEPPDDDFDDDDSISDGHGTMCAGVAGAETNNGTGIAGVSWYPRLIPVKVLDSEGNGVPSHAASAIMWAADNGADVVSMSMGSIGDSDEVHGACEYARALGCVLVAASGNFERSGLPMYPGGYPEVICVGATDQNEMRWHRGWQGIFLVGSNWGYHVDVVAPAGEVGSLRTTARGGGYTLNFGCTSAACPHVSGLAALVISANDSLSPAQVQGAVEFSADDSVYTRLIPYEVASAGRDVSTGYGEVNCERALEFALAKRFAIRDSAGSHLASFDEEGNFVLEGNGFSQDSVDSSIITSQELEQELLARSNCDEFLVRDGNGTILARLTGDEDPLWDSDADDDRDDDSDGLVDEMMFIRGRLYENVSLDLDAAVSVPCLRVKNAEGSTVALINSTAFTNATIEVTSPNTVLAGSLILKGRALIGVNPDRQGSIGQ